MSVTLRVLLFVGSVVTLFYIQRKIRKSAFGIDEASYWIFLFGVLVVMSIFPNIVSTMASLLGFESGSNFVFLIIIFLLLINNFSLSKRLSNLEEKNKELVQVNAIEEYMRQKEVEKI